MEGSNMITTLLIIGGVAIGGSMLFGFNIVPNFDFLGIQFNWITALIIIAFFGVLIWGAIKSWKIFLVLCVVGVLAMSYLAIGSLLDYREMKARQSNVRGELQQRIPFEDMCIHNFDVDINALHFMPAGQNDSLGNPIMFVVLNLPRFDLNDDKPLWMLVNNRPVFDMYTGQRELEAVHILLFSDGLGATSQVNLWFMMTFYQTHTRLQIHFGNRGDCHNLLLHYFALHGLNIRLIEMTA
jgi:hypothetical protein